MYCFNSIVALILFYAFFYFIFSVYGLESGVCPRNAHESFLAGIEFHVNDLGNIINKEFESTKVIDCFSNSLSNVTVSKLTADSIKPLESNTKLTQQYLAGLYSITPPDSNSSLFRFYIYVNEDTTMLDIFKIKKIYTNPIKQTVNIDVSLSTTWFGINVKYENNYFSQSGSILLKNFQAKLTLRLSLENTQCICYEDDITTWTIKIMNTISTLNIDKFDIDFIFRSQWDGAMKKTIEVATESYQWAKSWFVQSGQSNHGSNSNIDDSGKFNILREAVIHQFSETANTMIHNLGASYQMEQKIQATVTQFVKNMTHVISGITESGNDVLSQYCISINVRQFSMNHVNIYLTYNENLLYARSRDQSKFKKLLSVADGKASTASGGVAIKPLEMIEKLQSQLQSTLDRYWGDDHRCRSSFTLLVNFVIIEKLLNDNIQEIYEAAGLGSQCEQMKWRKTEHFQEYKKYLNLFGIVICLDHDGDKLIDDILVVRAAQVTSQAIQRRRKLTSDIMFKATLHCKMISTKSESIFGFRDAFVDAAYLNTVNDAPVIIQSTLELNKIFTDHCDDGCLSLASLVRTVGYNLVQNVHVAVKNAEQASTNAAKSNLLQKLRKALIDAGARSSFTKTSQWCFVSNFDLAPSKILKIQMISTRSNAANQEQTSFAEKAFNWIVTGK